MKDNSTLVNSKTQTHHFENVIVIGKASFEELGFEFKICDTKLDVTLPEGWTILDSEEISSIFNY